MRTDEQRAKSRKIAETYRKRHRKPCPMCGVLINKDSKYCKICFHKDKEYLSKFRATSNKNRKKNYCVDCKKQITLRAKRCIRCGRSGKNNPQWKGGVTILKERIRDLFEYRQWRSDVFTRDKFTCIECEQIGDKLNAHHIIPLNVLIQKYEITSIKHAINCDELWNINNGKTLCKVCHLKLHKEKGLKYGKHSFH